jgi:hypothetical protein
LSQNKAENILRDNSHGAKFAAATMRHFSRQSDVFDLSELMHGSSKSRRIEKKDIKAYHFAVLSIFRRDRSASCVFHP